MSIERTYYCEGPDCLMKFAAKQPLPIVIPWDEALGGDPDAA